VALLGGIPCLAKASAVVRAGVVASRKDSLAPFSIGRTPPGSPPAHADQRCWRCRQPKQSPSQGARSRTPGFVAS
jgi:hypothetical protein